MTPLCRLYLITPDRLEPRAFADELAAALDAGDMAAVQLRLKGADEKTVRAAIDVLCPVAQQRGVAFILNDDPELAAATGCDGVHVGQDDMTCREARQIVGDNAIVGVTCHDSRDLAIDAAEEGADYVAFGAFYPTQTKEAKGHPTPDILAWWSEIMVVPCLAIGGITPGNLAPLVTAGADFIAVCSGVWQHAHGPAAAVKDYLDAIAKAEKLRAPAES